MKSVKHTTIRAVADVDPFYLYLHLVQTLGPGRAFLLDAAKDATESAYSMSLVGVSPVLEVQVKDGAVSLFAVEGLRSHLQEALSVAGFHSEPSQSLVDAEAAMSVLNTRLVRYQGVDCMALLEQLRLALKSCFRGETLPPFANGLFGYYGYDAVQYLERLPHTTVDDREIPDIRLQWFTTVLQIRGQEVQVFDVAGVLHDVATMDGEVRVQTESAAGLKAVNDFVENPYCPEVPHAVDEMAKAEEDVTPEKFMQNVERAKQYIRSGDIFQVVLSKRLRVTKQLHPYAVYDRLRKLNPSPYMFFAEYPDLRLFGASPEVQFRAVDGVAEMKPIAGTSRGRGKTPDEDAVLEQRLLDDEKERAEHVMLVDLCRNDLGRVCATGSIRVDDFMRVEPYSHLFHLVSKVTGRLRDDVSIFHAMLSTFPAGTLSGAPKIRAMEIVDELESVRRGPYGGFIGIVDFDGNANTAIIIRTIVEVNDTYYVQVGAGIVADSHPETEWRECGIKAGAILDVLGLSVQQV